MLKKAIDSLNKISENLLQIDRRIAALEHWKEYKQSEIDKLSMRF